MGIIYNSLTPTDGLILSLDTANRRSYPGTGNTWFDLSGNNNHGTLTSGPVLNTGPGGGMSFDGTNDHIDMGDCCDFTSGHITISAWVKRSETTTADRTMVSKFGRNAGTTTEDGFIFRIFQNNLQYAAVLDGASHLFSTASANFNSTEFMHVAAVVQSGNGSSAKLFRNGILQSASWTLLNGNITLDNNPYPLRIGNATYQFGGGDFGHFAGSIDDVRIYNRPLSESEIRILFNSRRRRYGL